MKEQPSLSEYRQYLEELQNLKKQLLESNTKARFHHSEFRKFRELEKEIRKKLIEKI